MFDLTTSNDFKNFWKFVFTYLWVNVLKAFKSKLAFSFPMGYRNTECIWYTRVSLSVHSPGLFINTKKSPMPRALLSIHYTDNEVCSDKFITHSESDKGSCYPFCVYRLNQSKITVIFGHLWSEKYFNSFLEQKLI